MVTGTGDGAYRGVIGQAQLAQNVHSLAGEQLQKVPCASG